jgi:hypothetical protein
LQLFMCRLFVRTLDTAAAYARPWSVSPIKPSTQSTWDDTVIYACLPGEPYSRAPFHPSMILKMLLREYQFPNIRVSDHDGQVLIFDAADFA